MSFCLLYFIIVYLRNWGLTVWRKQWNNNNISSRKWLNRKSLYTSTWTPFLLCLLCKLHFFFFPVVHSASYCIIRLCLETKQKNCLTQMKLPSALSTITYYMNTFFLTSSSKRKKKAIINNCLSTLQLWKTSWECRGICGTSRALHLVCSLDLLLLRPEPPWRLSGPIPPSADGL